MTDDDSESPEGGQFERFGWRSALVGAGLFVAGLLIGATLLGDVGEVPCYEVRQRAQPAQDVLAETFGGGDEGRQAIRELALLAREHPGCFDPAEVELLEQHLQQSPDEPATDEATVEASVDTVPND